MQPFSQNGFWWIKTCMPTVFTHKADLSRQPVAWPVKAQGPGLPLVCQLFSNADFF